MISTKSKRNITIATEKGIPTDIPADNCRFSMQSGLLHPYCNRQNRSIGYFTAIAASVFGTEYFLYFLYFLYIQLTVFSLPVMSVIKPAF